MFPTDQILLNTGNDCKKPITVSRTYNCLIHKQVMSKYEILSAVYLRKLLISYSRPVTVIVQLKATSVQLTLYLFIIKIVRSIMEIYLANSNLQVVT